jgi:diadenosine tetraphosphate (Ap4A) HIT family hydrolase
MEQKPFKLAAELARDCIHLGDFPLCRVLLVNDRQYPWFILVPRRPDIKEIFQLEAEDQQRLARESGVFAKWLSESYLADKINIAALGNMVPQLHIHHIARYKIDAAWPGPVWGVNPAVALNQQDAEALALKLLELHQLPGFVPA